MTNISHTSIGASTRLLTFDDTSLSIHIPLAGESQPSSCKVVWATSIEATTILYYRVNGESEWIPFIDDGSRISINVWEDKCMGIWDIKTWDVVPIDNDMTTVIKHVHKLPNLYIALTGQELPINQLI